VLTAQDIPISSTGVIHGEILTRDWVVSMILDLAGYVDSNDLGSMRILEPAAGTGAFISVILDRLIASAKSHGASLTDDQVGSSIRAFDIQEENCRALRKLVVQKLTDAGVTKATASKLSDLWIVHDDFLLTDQSSVAGEFDVVVGNPPYIRMEDIPPAKALQYRDSFRTMTGRADIYVAFFEEGLHALNPDGKLVFICADRWMRNDYGKGLRQFITTGEYALDAVITAHDADVFERQVDAYPAIVVLRKGKQASVSIADTTTEFCERESKKLISAVVHKTHISSHSFDVGVVPHWLSSGTEPWPHGSPSTLKRLARLGELPTIEDTGAKIGIGIATGADAVYVTHPSRPLPDVEEARLLPLSHADDIRNGTWNWTGRFLVNPWDAGGLTDLALFPRTKRYLTGHEAVRGRNVAQRNPKTWWRTIDRVAFRLLDRSLILLQDMSLEVTPVVAPKGFYPHHNLYWIDVQDSGWDPEVLAGILLSDQVRDQVAARCVLMRGKTLRLQAQYLRQIRIPSPTELTKSTTYIFKKAYKTKDRELATATLRPLLPE